jgi:hypothetical protein
LITLIQLITLSQSLYNNEEDIIAAAVPQAQQHYTPTAANNLPALHADDAMDEDNSDSSSSSNNDTEVELLREQILQLQEYLITIQQEIATATNLIGQQAAQNTNL